MAKIFVLEDNLEDQLLYKLVFGKNHELSFCDRSEGFLPKLERFNPDLVILDVNLTQEGDGFKALSEMLGSKSSSGVPVFMVSAQNDLSKRLLGLSIGADDYITKPFEPKELLLKVEGKIKRHGQHFITKNLVVGPIRLDINEQKAFLEYSGVEQELDLTLIEFKLLKFFLSHEGKVISRAELMEKVWGANVFVSDRNIDTRVSTLRKKLKPYGRFFNAIYGSGYSFDLKDYYLDQKSA